MIKYTFIWILSQHFCPDVHLFRWLEIRTDVLTKPTLKVHTFSKKLIGLSSRVNTGREDSKKWWRPISTTANCGWLQATGSTTARTCSPLKLRRKPLRSNQWTVRATGETLGFSNERRFHFAFFFAVREERTEIVAPCKFDRWACFPLVWNEAPSSCRMLSFAVFSSASCCNRLSMNRVSCFLTAVDFQLSLLELDWL